MSRVSAPIEVGRMGWGGVRPRTAPHLSNAYMAGIDLGGNDLRGAHGAGVCLVNARLARVLFGEWEGVRTSLAITRLAAGMGVEMPICQQMVEVIYAGKEPLHAIAELMLRELKPENAL